MVRDKAEAEEMSQETYTRALERIGCQPRKSVNAHGVQAPGP